MIGCGRAVGSSDSESTYRTDVVEMSCASDVSVSERTPAMEEPEMLPAALTSMVAVAFTLPAHSLE